VVTAQADEPNEPLEGSHLIPASEWWVADAVKRYKPLTYGISYRKPTDEPDVAEVWGVSAGRNAACC
jgi:hypothetical protein